MANDEPRRGALRGYSVHTTAECSSMCKRVGSLLGLLFVYNFLFTACKYLLAASTLAFIAAYVWYCYELHAVCVYIGIFISANAATHAHWRAYVCVWEDQDAFFLLAQGLCKQCTNTSNYSHTYTPMKKKKCTCTAYCFTRRLAQRLGAVERGHFSLGCISWFNVEYFLQNEALPGRMTRFQLLPTVQRD